MQLIGYDNRDPRQLRKVYLDKTGRDLFAVFCKGAETTGGDYQNWNLIFNRNEYDSEASDFQFTSYLIKVIASNKWFYPCNIYDVKDTKIGKVIFDDLLDNNLVAMKAYILDTETHSLVEPRPIEIAYIPTEFAEGKLIFDGKAFLERYNPLCPISLGSMNTTGICDEDVATKLSYTEFVMPNDCEYIIGHNIDFDCEVIENTGNKLDNVKRICTLALSRYYFPELDSHALGSMLYHVAYDTARAQMKNAHNAKYDIWFTYIVLNHICATFGITSMEQLYQTSQVARIPTKMNFGKHKGMDIKDIPVDYIKYMLNQDIDEYTKIAFKNRLDSSKQHTAKTESIES